MILEKLSNKHRKLIILFLFVFIIFLECCIFPIYNFSKDMKITIRLINIIPAIALCNCIGELESIIFTNKKRTNIALLNLIIIILGMITRYLLEYGEVSNVMNFTLENVVFHILFNMIGISFFFRKAKKLKN